MIEIIHRYTKAVLYTNETANSILEAIKEAVLSGAYLSGAYLSGAYLRGAYLSGADLSGAYLRGAYLSGADLSGADLSGADLSGADLSGAYLRGAYLSGAEGLLPNGVTPLQIGGSRDWIIVRQAGHITIGCEHHPLTWWEEHYKAIGHTNDYTDAQVAEYYQHIQYCRQWMLAHDVLNEALA